MDILLLLFPILMIPKMQIAKKGEFFDSLSLENSQVLKGISALLVVFAHLSTNIQKPFPNIVMNLFVYVGPLAVAVFFFLSGYGLTFSYLKKGDEYLNGFFRKRLLSLIVPFLIVLVPYNLIVVLRGRFVLNDFFYSVIDGDPLNVKYSWYVAVILLFYVLFFIVAKLSKGKRNQLMLIMLSITIVYVGACLASGIPSHYYSSVIGFLLGMVFACHKEKAEAVMNSRWLPLSLASPIIFAAAIGVRTVKSHFGLPAVADEAVALIATYTATSFFVLTFILWTRKLKFKNPVLLFFGDISYGIYLTHGLSFTLIKIFADSMNPFVFSAIALPATVLFAWLLTLITKPINKMIRGR